MMQKNLVESGRPHTTVHMHAECWVPKATKAHLEYVILIDFPWQKLLHECASVLRYTYIACHVAYGK